jgi:hypothetical protein
MKKLYFVFLGVIILFFSTTSLSNAQEYNITNITNHSYWDMRPQINASGQVVWSGFDGSDWEIFMCSICDGSDNTQITDNSYSDHATQINASGQVVWHGGNGSDYEIFLATPLNR